MSAHQLQTLPELWRCWVEMVTLFAHRAPGRLRVNPAEYQALHQALLNECNARAGVATPECRVWLQSLDELARPWLSLAAMERADRELLADLLARCRDVENNPSGGGCLMPVQRRSALVWLCLGGVVLPAVLLAVINWIWPSLQETTKPVWRAVRLSWRELLELGPWLGGGLLLVVFMLVVMAFYARR